MTTKVALITGGAEGLGREYVKLLLSLGWRVSYCDLKDGEIKDALYSPCDVTNETQLETFINRTIKEYGHLDLVIPNAGITSTSPRSSGLPSTKIIDVNFTAVVRTIELALPHCKADATLCFISSLYGLYPLPLDPLYAATKHAVLGYARSLNVTQRVVIMGPSYIKTALIDAVPEELLSSTVGILTVEAYIDIFKRALEEAKSGEFWEVLSSKVNIVDFRPLPNGLDELHTTLLSSVSSN